MIPDTYSDERLIQIIEVNRRRLAARGLGEFQRAFLSHWIEIAEAELKARGVDPAGIAA